MRQQAELYLAVIRVHQDAAGRGDEHAPYLRAQLAPDGDVLQVRLRARKAARGRHRHAEVRVYAPVGGDDLEQAVRVGALQLRQHAIFQDIAYDGVLAYELFQDVGVGAPAGLGLLARWEHQLIEQHLAQLLGRVYIELVPGQLPDAALQGVYTRREALTKVGQGLPVHQDTRALHLGQHLAERQLDIEIELLRPVFRQLRAHGGHELQRSPGFRQLRAQVTFGQLA